VFRVSVRLPRRAGGPEMGTAEEQAGHELRQAEQIAQILLREGHHAKSGR